jgi:hypothetical protein
MDLNHVLTGFTIAGLATSFAGGIASQIWKSSQEIEGRITKRLTPAGWLSLGVALVGLSGSIASELIRVNMQNAQQIQDRADAAQKRALQEQEAQWRSDTSALLTTAKQDIESNLGHTITGFQTEQQTSLQNMHQIILSGQPLTSLSLRLSFTSTDRLIWKTMARGQADIKKNAESEQGGVPLVPLDLEEDQSSVFPLLSFVATVDSGSKEGKSYERNREYLKRSPKSGEKGDSRDSLLVLMPLDESQNTILSFGKIDGGSNWWDAEPTAKTSSEILGLGDTRRFNSSPEVTLNLTKDSGLNPSKYTMSWQLDPVTLANAIDRTNKAITPTAKLPSTLKIAILYDIGDIPFRQNSFAESFAANLWGDNEQNRTYITLGSEFRNVGLSIEVNGFQEKKYRYLLKRLYRLDLLQDDDDGIDTGCTVLEFETI